MSSDSGHDAKGAQRGVQPQESALGWLSDPADVRVVAGLTRRCSMCGAKKGVWCVELGTGNRRPELHMWRAGEAA